MPEKNSLSRRQRFDEACDQFESALKSNPGANAGFFELLESVPAEERDSLAIELILLEKHYREKQNSSADETYFLERYPHLAPAVLQALQQDPPRAAPSPPDDSDATVAPISWAIDETTIPVSGPMSHSGAARGDTSLAGERVKYFGDYEVLDEIARGGMGVVYRARQSGLNRIVALKMILSGNIAGQEEVVRFKTEAKAAAKLDHWGIVPIYEIGEYQGQHYFSMAYVEGKSLQDKLNNGPLEPKVAAQLCGKICEAIEYAHQNGVVHRDLKPANVLLDAAGIPKITDFGLAKQVESNSDLTRSGAVMGTPSYMPPEQASGSTESIGPLSDVYSVGAMLYCLTTGRPPFQSANTFDVLMQVIEKDPVAPVLVNPNIPLDLQTITLKCLEKKPEQRYQSAAELNDELQRFLAGQPILARPVTKIERTWRWCARNPALAGWAALAAGLLMVLSIGGPIMAFNQTRLKQIAEDKRTEAETLANRNEKLAAQNAVIAEEESFQREEAVRQRNNADEKRIEAETLAEVNRKQLASSQLEQADRVLNPDPGSALVHYLEALRLDEVNPVKERLHRIRIRSAFGQVPKFTNFWKHDGPVNHITLDSSEKRVATSSTDRTAEVRSLDSGELVFPPFKHALPVIAAAFSQDGKKLATVSSSGVANETRIWDLESGRQLGEAIIGVGYLYRVSWTPSGRIATLGLNLFGGGFALTVFSDSGQVVEKLAIPAMFNTEKTNGEIDAATGRFLQASGADFGNSTIRVIDLDDRLNTLAEFDHPAPVVFAAFNRAASRVVSATDSQLFVWDIASEKKVGESQAEALRYAGVSLNSDMQCQFSFDGRSVVAVTNSEHSFVFASVEGAANNSTNIVNLTAIPVTDTVSRVASPNGRWMALADATGTVRIWDVAGERFEAAPMHHSTAINWMEFTQDGRRLLTTCIDGTVRVWDFASTYFDRYDRYGHSIGPVDQARLSEDGSELSSAGFRWTRLSNLKTGETWMTRHGSDVIALTVPRNDLVAIGTNTNKARVFNQRTGKYVSPELKHERQFVHQVKLSENGKWLATIASLGLNGPSQAIAEGFIWDVESGEPRYGPLSFAQTGVKQPGLLGLLNGIAPGLANSGVTAIGISPNHRIAAYGGGSLQAGGRIGPLIRLINLETGQETELDHGDGQGLLFVWGFEFSKSGKYVLSHGINPMNERGGELRVWDVETGKTILGPFSRPNMFRQAVFSDDERLVAFSADRFVDILDIKTGKRACRPLAHPDNVSQLSLSPKGLSAATSTDANDVRVWDLSEGRMLVPAKPHSFPVNQVTMLSDARVMICSHMAATIWTFEPAIASANDIRQVARLLTGQSLDDFGVAQVSADTLTTDWEAVKEKNPTFMAATHAQIVDWYSRLLNEYGSSRSWSASAFHRENLIKLLPEDSFIWDQQVLVYGENRQFREAADYLKKLIEKDHSNPENYYRIMPALLATGNREDYQKYCNDFVLHHKATEVSEVADQLVIALTIGNAELDDQALPERLIKEFLAKSPQHTWLLIAKSMVELRAERNEECISTCDKVLKTSTDDHAQAYVLAIRAIAKQNLGQDGSSDRNSSREKRDLIFWRSHGQWYDLTNIDLLLAESIESDSHDGSSPSGKSESEDNQLKVDE